MILCKVNCSEVLDVALWYTPCASKYLSAALMSVCTPLCTCVFSVLNRNINMHMIVEHHNIN